MRTLNESPFNQRAQKDTMAVVGWNRPHARSFTVTRMCCQLSPTAHRCSRPCNSYATFASPPSLRVEVYMDFVPDQWFNTAMESTPGPSARNEDAITPLHLASYPGEICHPLLDQPGLTWISRRTRLPSHRAKAAARLYSFVAANLLASRGQKRYPSLRERSHPGD
jgi:hypothetical protein